MKCKNGHEFEFPAYVIQRIRTGLDNLATTGPDLGRYEIMTPVCPICQHPLAMPPPEEKKKDVRRRKKQKPKPQIPVRVVEEETENQEEDVA